jgi:chromosome segregation ATPase
MSSTTKLCLFATVNGSLCKCYKMKGENHCKAHNNDEWESEIEFEEDNEEDNDDYWNVQEYNFKVRKMTDFEEDLQEAKQTIDNLENVIQDMDKKLIVAQQTIDLFENSISSMEKYYTEENYKHSETTDELYLVNEQLRQYKKHQKNINGIQLFACVCILISLTYANVERFNEFRNKYNLM